jgi:hypothetical protein
VIAWKDTRADHLSRGDIVLIPSGHLRVVTAVEPVRGGRVHLRLGVTWYAVEPHRTFAVDTGRRR